MARRPIGIKGFVDMLISDISNLTILDEISKIIDFDKIWKELKEKFKFNQTTGPSSLAIMKDLSLKRQPEERYA